MAFQEKQVWEEKKVVQTSTLPDEQCRKEKNGNKMDTLICNSYEMLKEYSDPKLYPNHQIPYDLFQTCKGIMFLRIWKGGVVLGGLGGTGIIMARNNGSWSHPCAISVGGLQIGLQLGIERVDDILLLRDDAALRLFIDKGHFKLGIDASIAAGNFGRDANSGITMSGGESKSIYSYSFAKGAFIGLSLDGGVLSIDNSVNEEYYGRKVGINDIFYGNLLCPQDNNFANLQQILNSHCLNQQKILNEPANVHDVINPVINQ